MGCPDEHFEHRVDEVLTRAWPRERRRASRRLWGSALGRWGGGMAAIALLAGIFALTGAGIPWLLFPVMGLLSAIAVLPEPAERAHLRLERTPDEH